ncbi:hypothetical protein SDC9_196796 [bioreactor metagenome]|uniref:Uncharacterized protein n=1 Tax=bioreactor metagenome TaxID=1076179 RepID=A0A645ICV7_9ZZZZ
MIVMNVLRGEAVETLLPCGREEAKRSGPDGFSLGPEAVGGRGAPAGVFSKTASEFLFGTVFSGIWCFGGVAMGLILLRIS